MRGADQVDLYEVLDVPVDADLTTIKAAFRRIARDSHPDVGGDEDAFKIVNHAYQVLSDPNQRAEYDRARGVGEPAGARGDGQPGTDGAATGGSESSDGGSPSADQAWRDLVWVAGRGEEFDWGGGAGGLRVRRLPELRPSMIAIGLVVGIVAAVIATNVLSVALMFVIEGVILLVNAAIAIVIGLVVLVVAFWVWVNQ